MSKAAVWTKLVLADTCIGRLVGALRVEPFVTHAFSVQFVTLAVPRAFLPFAWI